jgi:Tfp pilus assembly protein PilO
VTLTDRDRKIVLFLGPLVLILAYWFLLLTPKREEASVAAEQLAVQEDRRDMAQQRLDQLTTAQADFAADYAQLVRLGKAVPASVDMPTLLVQLQAASQGTDISFTSIATGEREAAPAPPPPPPAPGTGDGSQPAAAGGAPAQSAPGAAAETAGNTVAGANNASSAAEQSGVDPADTATSTAARDGAIPVGGGAADPAAPGAIVPGAAPGLESVPLDLEFRGNFFDLADFFHDLKRYVESAEDEVLVRGRLLTIDGLSFSSDPEIFPELRVEITATAYLAPKAQGVTAGATPQGPAATPVTETTSAPAPALPTATATP